MDTAFREVEEHFPDCLKWVLSSYGVEAELVLGENIILSRAGFHQGGSEEGSRHHLTGGTSKRTPPIHLSHSQTSLPAQVNSVATQP